MSIPSDSNTNSAASHPVRLRVPARTRLLKTFQKTSIGYLFLLPALLFYIPFIIIPFIKTIYLSGFNMVGVKTINFVGLGNYIRIFSDPIFWASFKNNILWAGITLIIPILFGLFLGILLCRTKLWGRTLFRTLLFLPQVLNSVIVAIIWRWMYRVDIGPVNIMLQFIGLGSIARGWLANHTLALPALALANSWAYYGFCMVVFIAAIQGIDVDLFDAAKIDGANSFQEFWYVTLPELYLTITVVILFTLIGSFKVFDIVYVGTLGGPGYSSWVISYYLYNYTWTRGLPGIGLAAGVIQTIFIATITTVFLLIRQRQLAK